MVIRASSLHRSGAFDSTTSPPNAVSHSSDSFETPDTHWFTGSRCSYADLASGKECDEPGAERTVSRELNAGDKFWGTKVER